MLFYVLRGIQVFFKILVIPMYGSQILKMSSSPQSSDTKSHRAMEDLRIDKNDLQIWTQHVILRENKFFFIRRVHHRMEIF